MILVAASLLIQPAPDCRDPSAQAVQDACALQPVAVAEAEMNRALVEATRELQVIDRANRNRDTEQKLVAAQRAWAAYRDAQCALAGLQAIDAGLRETLEERCRTELTRHRTQELRALGRR